MAPKIRPIDIAGDAECLLGVERLCFERQWRLHDFKRFMDLKRGMGWVAEQRRCLVGYAFCEAFDDRLQLIRIAVHPRHWGRGIGRNLLRLIKSGLQDDGRNRILAEVSERNVHAQMFLKHCSFQATGAVRNFFGDDEGSISMAFFLQPRDPHLDFFSFRRSQQR
jgi:ribosomal protein S18 acetylase RimI-like enzyme